MYRISSCIPRLGSLRIAGGLAVVLGLPLSACTSGKSTDSGAGDVTGEDGADGADGADGGDDGASGEQSTVRGRIDDAAARRVAGVGGEGTVAATSSVRAVAEDGTVIGEGEVDASGSFAIVVEPDETMVVLEGLTADGEVAVRALLTSTAAAGEERISPTLDAESSLEALVWAELEGSGGAAGDPHDARARIDSRVAAEVVATLEAGEASVEEVVAGLAASVEAAQAAELSAWSDAGLDITHSAVARATADATLALDAALYAGGSSAEAFEDYQDAVVEAMLGLGATAREHARAESRASASARVAADVHFSSGELRAVAEAVAVAAAEGEAAAMDAAVAAALEAASAGAATMEAGAATVAELRADLHAAASLDAAVAAWAAAEASVMSTADVESCLVGASLGAEADVSLAATLETVIEASLAASAAYEASLVAAVEAGIAAGGAVDVNGVVEAVADAHTTFSSGVATAATFLPTDDLQTGAAVDMMVLASGGFAATH